MDQQEAVFVRGEFEKVDVGEGLRKKKQGEIWPCCTSSGSWLWLQSTIIKCSVEFDEKLSARGVLEMTWS